MKRRTFLAAAIGGAAVSQTACQYVPASPVTGSAAPGDFELDEVSLADVGSGLEQGKWTSARLVELYLGRIDAIDRHGPQLNSVLALNPDAAANARQLDEERKNGKLRGPLHGIPILLKDNIETKDTISTTAGSLALADWRSPQDAFVPHGCAPPAPSFSAKLISANGRTTAPRIPPAAGADAADRPKILTRWIAIRPARAPVRARRRCSLCAVAVGTETDGSVTGPSSINGIVGIKPTVGLVSRSGIIPISISQDTAGPMARTVRDVAILLSVMAGVDPQDPAGAASQGKATDYTRSLDPKGLRGARLGIARKFFQNNAPLDAFLNGCIDALKRAGAEVVDPADLRNARTDGSS